MNTTKSIFFQKRIHFRIIFGWMLVFIIAFSSMSSYTILLEMEIDKIEKLVEGEIDLDMEEKEKNSEIEEDSFVNTHFDRKNLSQGRLHASQYLGQLTIYHLKIPTPPPDRNLL